MVQKFGGPCPPEGHGIHEYIITVFALKTDKLGLNENINPAIVDLIFGTKQSLSI
jgi:phosphatidylethanolamine-binding protein (PEBP) family uncharacterized protein